VQHARFAEHVLAAVNLLDSASTSEFRFQAVHPPGPERAERPHAAPSKCFQRSHRDQTGGLMIRSEHTGRLVGSNPVSAGT
jgi:hypothetical protein